MVSPEEPSSSRLKTGEQDARSQKFARYVWFFFSYILAVVAFGAFVRATGSGAGCGSHWPDCDGRIIPRLESTEQIIEFTHRVTSGIITPMLIVMVVWARRVFEKGHPARSAVTGVVVFTVIEALIGAVLVTRSYVGENASLARAGVLSLHLINTFLLVGSIVTAAWWGGGVARPRWRGQGAIGWALGLALFSLAAVGISGALSALGNTLFPVTSIAQGLRDDLSPTSHILQQLRLLHPFLSISAGLYLVLVGGLMSALRPSPLVKKTSIWLESLLAVQILVGLANIALHAPIPMQLIHLVLGELMWGALAVLAASALAEDVKHKELSPEFNYNRSPEELVALGPATIKDYVALTKPRVISLLLFTTWTGMVIAAQGWPGMWLFLATGLGLYMAAGASNAINMVLERDLDVRMERTASRPTVTQKIPPRAALKFAFALAAGSFALLWITSNILAALLALAGLVVYVIVYTLLLKRRTWSNIVIGGAAGAFPPLVGYAAVAGDLTPLAWCLFAIIFLWTPVHFWALALLIKDDYAAAGVPMLPVVKGEHNTAVQIVGYAILTAAISAAPLLLGVRGYFYVVVAVVLNAILLWQSWDLLRQVTRPRASKLFHYSMLYLALLFLAMALDRAYWNVV
jgi:protoheme IX farnesyltransferase